MDPRTAGPGGPSGPPPARPSLPSMSAPGSSAGRPTSSADHAPQVGHGPLNLFGGGTSLPPGDRGGDLGPSAPYPGYGSNGTRDRERERESEHPNKRLRAMDDEDRYPGPPTPGLMGKPKGTSLFPFFPRSPCLFCG